MYVCDSCNLGFVQIFLWGSWICEITQNHAGQESILPDFKFAWLNHSRFGPIRVLWGSYRCGFSETRREKLLLVRKQQCSSRGSCRCCYNISCIRVGEHFFTEIRAKSSTEGFCQWKRCFFFFFCFSPNWLRQESYNIMRSVDLIGWIYPVIDSDRHDSSNHLPSISCPFPSSFQGQLHRWFSVKKAIWHIRLL